MLLFRVGVGGRPWVPDASANNLDVKPRGSAYLTAVLTVAVAGCSVSPLPVESPALGRWRSPPATQQDLLYASTIEGRVFVFSFPRGGLAGTFDVPAGEDVWGACADRKGDVFITSERSETSSFVYEYAHGGTTPIATLRDDGYVAADCASDPATGDLAVASYDEGSSGGANVAVYAGARGKPRRYVDSKLSVAFCGYDGRGNLFVDGHGAYQLAELPKGSATFKNLTLSEQLVRPGGIEWDGKYLAIEDGGYARRFAAIDRVAVSNDRANVVGTIRLKGLANRGATFWLADGYILTAGGQQVNRIGLWHYPAGGDFIKLFRGMGIRGQTFYGVAVSVVP